MVSKRKFLFAIFIVALLGVIVLPFFNCNQTSAYHEFLGAEIFKKLSRTDQVKKCASCHKQEYESELIGPHSHAYEMLKEHKAFVNSDLYQCYFYTKTVNEQVEGSCSGCHTPQNLFEYLLHDSIKTPGEMAAQIMQSSHVRPDTRTGEASRITAIDCFNCHFDGNKMVSLKHVASKEDTIPSLQTIAVIAKNNISCFPCHGDLVRGINPAFAIKRTGSVLCKNCHQEYDEAGKGTHYYYWNKGPEKKVDPKLFSMMDDFHFNFSPNKKAAEITWINTTIPHPMSPGPETIIKCEVLDKDSNLLGTKIIRTNRKKQFDADVLTQPEIDYCFGVQGDAVTFDGSPLTYSIVLKNPSKAELFRVSLIHKAQFWFQDSLGVLTAVKVYPVNK